MKKILFIFLSFSALSACAAPMPYRMAANSDRILLAAREMENGLEPTADGQGNLPTQELTASIVYRLLLAEIAAQRGRLNVATATYLDLAKSTKDPRIAQRATEIAVYGRQPAEALEAAKLWSEADPQSQQARQIIVSVLLSQGKFSDARPYLQKMLSGEEPQVRQGFMELNAMLARQNDKRGALELAQQLAQPHPKMAEAHYAIAQTALGATQNDLALSEVKQANELKPGWDAGALLQAQILWQANREEAVKYYDQFLASYPNSNEVRLSYARLLASQKNIPGARAQLETLVKASPDNPGMLATAGMLSGQLQDYAAAESYLTRALKANPRDPDAIRFTLGQVNEEQKRYGDAATWYASVEAGEQYFSSQVKVASMLAKQNKLGEARAHLSGLKTESDAQKVQLVMADAGVLREVKAYQESFDRLDTGLKQFPDNPDLLYDRAMAAEKVNRIDVLEADLRKLITLKPDHAHAYNALGYTLADRTTRYAEAAEFISRALEFSPDDPFIVDSLGWVQFKQGKLDESIATLQRAFDIRPDPEIAAHLGEAMWAKGKRSEASKIWQTALRDHPENEALNEVVKRLK